MNKFWMVVAVIIVVGVGAVFLSNGSGKITFSDLETECRYNNHAQSAVTLNADNSLSFTGHFPANNPEQDVKYSYSQSSSSVTLNVYTPEMDEPADYFNNCLASAVYQGRTQPLDAGSYLLTVKHNGKEVEKKVIQVE
ncbi:MAG: hypothetical protein ABEJ99_01400 [Candidatus Nanohaloarchaea archaeon]